MNSETVSYKQETVAPAKTFVNRDRTIRRNVTGVRRRKTLSHYDVLPGPSYHERTTNVLLSPETRRMR
jgi:hypothetical protein